jgi:stage II sporulation protein M
MRRVNLFLNQQWDQAMNYYKENLKRLYGMTFSLFIVFSIMSTVFFINNPDLAYEFYNEIEKIFQEKDILDQSGMGLVISIFLNNISASVMIILLGFIPFFYFPIFSMFSNGMIIGVMGAVFQLKDIGLMPFAIGVLPHGVVEIPALVLSVVLGINICQKLVLMIIRRKEKIKFKFVLKESFRIFLLWLVPLFAIAAFIEGFITPILLGVFI